MKRLSYNKPLLLLRSSAYLSMFMITTLIFCVPMMLSYLVPLLWRYRLVRIYAMVNLWMLKVLCGLSYRIEGMVNLPGAPAVIFSKHQSTWETFCFIVELPAAAYVAKRELLWVPFFGWGMSALNYITIDRSSGRKAIEKIVAQARDRLARGLWIIVFPEGTRRPAGAPPQYKIGGAVMAVETGVPVVPVALNAGEFWPRHSLIKWPGEITMSIGPAIDTAGKKAEQVRDEARQWIEAKMEQLTVPGRFPY